MPLRSMYSVAISRSLFSGSREVSEGGCGRQRDASARPLGEDFGVSSSRTLATARSGSFAHDRERETESMTCLF